MALVSGAMDCILPCLPFVRFRFVCIFCALEFRRRTPWFRMGQLTLEFVDITALLFSALESDHHIALYLQMHHKFTTTLPCLVKLRAPSTSRSCLEWMVSSMKKLSRDYIHASYKTLGGSEIVVDWPELDADAVARGRAWRTLPWYLGQRNYSGLYWCATERAHVGYEYAWSCLA